LKEGFLRQLFGFGCVRHHAQAQGINTPAVRPVEVFKRSPIALPGSPDGFRLVQFFAFAAYRPGHGASFEGHVEMAWEPRAL